MGSDVKATPSVELAVHVELTVVHLSGAAGVDNGDHRCFRSDGIDEDLDRGCAGILGDGKRDLVRIAGCRCISHSCRLGVPKHFKSGEGIARARHCRCNLEGKKERRKEGKKEKRMGEKK